MTELEELGLRKIRRALISVSDKTGIVDFARELQAFDVGRQDGTGRSSDQFHAA